MSNSLWPDGLYSPWSSPGQNTGVGSLSLLQKIFPTRGSNPGFPHCRWTLYQLSHKRSPRILEWVVYPFSSGSSWPRNWTRVSWIAGGFFTNWAIREAVIKPKNRFLSLFLSLDQKADFIPEDFSQSSRNNFAFEVGANCIKAKIWCGCYWTSWKQWVF